MKTNLPRPSFVFSLGLLATAAAVSAQDFSLKLDPEGAAKHFKSFVPTSIELSAQKPVGLKKAPDSLKAPLYGTLKLGPAEALTSIEVIIDEPASGEARLFLDSNGNGDFTDDAPAKWRASQVKRSDGSDGVFYSGDGNLSVRWGKEDTALHFKFYRFDKNDPARAGSKFFYYRDYVRIGEVTLDSKTYRVALSDDMNRGDFRVDPNDKNPSDKKSRDKKPRTTLGIDVNGDGKFDPTVDYFPIGEPFNIAGKNYIAATPDADGGKVRISPSTVVAIEKKSQSTGDIVQGFTAKTMDGKTINFPGDFKGKLVMLDFWATWCGPCMAEVPNLVANHQKYRDQGFEVLGISLDKIEATEQVTALTTSKNMNWPHICEGGGWGTGLAKKFNVVGIPHTILVDGTTGKILADDELRGPDLSKTIEKHLAARSKAK